MKRSLRNALRRVNLEFRDISGLTTDGASVMRKLGRSLAQAAGEKPFYHQMCFAHALHLAVMDTFKHGADNVPDEEAIPGDNDAHEGREVEFTLVAAPESDTEAESGRVSATQ